MNNTIKSHATSLHSIAGLLIAAVGTAAHYLPVVQQALPAGSKPYLIAGALMIILQQINISGSASIDPVPSDSTPKQGGFARVWMLATIALATACMLFGCATTGGKAMDATTKVALETSVRIAVRHAVEGSPRAAEKAAHIRSIVATVQSVTSSQSTVAALEGVVRTEVAKLKLSPLDQADAEDLITLLGVSLESRFQGPDAGKLVAVNDFLGLVLSALPPAAS